MATIRSILLALVLLAVACDHGRAIPSNTSTNDNSIGKSQTEKNKIKEDVNELVPCTCGVFLNGQFTRGDPKPPRGNPALMHEQGIPFPCNAVGMKQCQNKCLDSIVKHLPNSPSIICGTIDRDCHKERAYLFIQNCNATWVNTNLSAGREYCCKDGVALKCPITLA